jgi:DNA-binding CsgD family transcriptional regulator/DNA-binding MarR family transcriptional regulator
VGQQEAESMVIGAVVPSLVRWGLSADADLVFRTLSSFGPQPARRIAADLGLATGRVRSALDELEAAGAVQATTGLRAVTSERGAATRVWRAQHARAAVTAIREHRLRLAERTSTDNARRHGTALNLVRAEATDVVLARRLPDSGARRRRIAELVSVERIEHLAMNPERAFSPEVFAAAQPLDLDLLRRRVKVRTLGYPPMDGDTCFHPADEFARLGGKYRELAHVPHKFIVFDRRVALMAINPLNLDQGTLEITEPTVVESLVTLFNRHWDSAVDPRRYGVPDIVLTPREKAIVALLAEGHTDATAAQSLGLSTRTVNYTLRSLMDRLGVDNRFQLGLALGAVGAAVPPASTQLESTARPDTRGGT